MISFLTFKQGFGNQKSFYVLFSLKSNLFRRVQKLGLINLYRNNIKIREIIRMFF